MTQGRLALMVALGGTCGALARWQGGLWLVERLNADWPWATLIINGVGSLLLGFLAGWPGAKTVWEGALWPLVAVGFMGAFTTFSTFSVETLTLIQQGRMLHALAYALASPLLGVLAAGGGYGVGQLL